MAITEICEDVTELWKSEMTDLLNTQRIVMVVAALHYQSIIRILQGPHVLSWVLFN